MIDLADAGWSVVCCVIVMQEDMVGWLVPSGMAACLLHGCLFLLLYASVVPHNISGCLT